MERNKAAERERLEQERQKCNAEQAVSKHFEESLRRAKEKVSLLLSFIGCAFNAFMNNNKRCVWEWKRWSRTD